MTLDQIAWIVRGAMVAAGAACTFLLTQPDGTLPPNVLLVVGLVNVILAALNPLTLAGKIVKADEPPVD